MELHVIVARNAGQEDFMSAWVDGDNHVDIATGYCRNIAISVDATDIDIERIARNIDIGDVVIFDFGFDCDGIYIIIIFGIETFKNLSGEVNERTFDKNGVSFVVYDGGDGGGKIFFGDFFVLDFFGKLIESFVVTFGTVIVGSNGAVVEIFDIFKFGIFFYEDRIIVDLIFRCTDRIHEIHGVI